MNKKRGNKVEKRTDERKKRKYRCENGRMKNYMKKKRMKKRKINI